jgi:hypothetical protein
MPRPRPRHSTRPQIVRRLKHAAIWAVVLAVVGGILYLLAGTSSIRYTERHLTPIDFTSLNEQQKHEALVQANAERCNCGCGMTLAQCVATDMTCPIRTDNIGRIRTLVQRALYSGGGS